MTCQSGSSSVTCTCRDKYVDRGHGERLKTDVLKASPCSDETLAFAARESVEVEENGAEKAFAEMLFAQ